MKIVLRMKNERFIPILTKGRSESFRGSGVLYIEPFLKMGLELNG